MNLTRIAIPKNIIVEHVNSKCNGKNVLTIQLVQSETTFVVEVKKKMLKQI